MTIFLPTWRRTALALGLIGGLTACAVGPGSAVAGPDGTQVLVLAAGKPVLLGEGGPSIELLSVQDSRCPVDVQCMWAGQAGVTLRLSLRGQAPVQLQLGPLSGLPAVVPKADPNAGAALSDADQPSDVLQGPYRLRLLALSPQPSSATPVALAQYRATVAWLKR